MGYKKKTDSNQSLIVQHLRDCNLHVIPLHAVGEGFPDLLVTGYHHGAERVLAALVEVKTARGKLTPAQEKFHSEYPADGPLIVARDSTDVLRWFGII